MDVWEAREYGLDTSRSHFSAFTNGRSARYASSQDRTPDGTTKLIAPFRCRGHAGSNRFALVTQVFAVVIEKSTGSLV
jgi:hypothetical protein